jgi:hypothetical protein
MDEGKLFPFILWPYHNYKQGQEDTVQHSKGIELGIHRHLSFTMIAPSNPSCLIHRIAPSYDEKRA